MLDHGLVEQLSNQANEILDEVEPIIERWQEAESKVEQDDIATVFRGLHTIKGGFGFFGLENIKHLSHALEDLLSEVRSMLVNVTADLADRCLQGIRLLRELCSAAWESDQRDISSVLESLGYASISGLRQAAQIADLSWPLEPSKEQCEQAIQMGRHIFRITMRTHRDIEEHGLTLLDMNDMLSAMGNPLSVAVGIDAIGGVDDCLDLDLPYQILFMSTIKREDLLPTLDIPGEQIEQLDLQDYLQESVQAPIDGVEYLLRSIGEVSSTLALRLGKKVSFVYEIEDVLLTPKQRMSLQGSLIHLLRNALDHGIELPEQRIVVQKHEAGSIAMATSVSDSSLSIRIEDDGAGIDPERIKQRAIERGLVDADRQFARDEEVFALLFAPGFSTCDAVSEVSGRGVGMDVVKQQIEDLGGHIVTTSTLGQGTVFTLHIPR